MIYFVEVLPINLQRGGWVAVFSFPFGQKIWTCGAKFMQEALKFWAKVLNPPPLPIGSSPVGSWKYPQNAGQFYSILSLDLNISF